MRLPSSWRVSERRTVTTLYPHFKKIASLQILYLILQLHFSDSLRITPDTGWYITERNRRHSVIFQCHDAVGPIVWKRNGIALVQNGSCFTSADIKICNGIVHIYKFRNDFAGKYTCEDTRDSTSVDLGGWLLSLLHCFFLDNTWFRFQYVVTLVAPEFVKPGDVEVVFRSATESLNVSCEVEQYVYPRASVTWFTIHLGGKVKVQDGDTLTRSEIGVKGVSFYTCEAKNYPNGVPRRKSFFVLTYEPANCTVVPGDVAVLSGERVDVNVTLSGNPLPVYSLIDPWRAVRLDSSSLRAEASVNSSGIYPILHIVQNVSFRGSFRVFSSTCQVYVLITGQRSPEVCILMEQRFNPSRCSTTTLTGKAGKLSRSLLFYLQTSKSADCYWNVTIHYIVSRRRSDCTSMRIGASVSLSQHDCSTSLSMADVRNATRTWIRDQSALLLTVESYNKSFCTLFSNELQRLQNFQKPVHFRCSSKGDITRFCTLCSKCSSKCRELTETGTRVNVLNSMCSTST